jgi:hypothetical protein
MIGKRKSPNKGTLNSELMQRIDNMDDKMDFDPYQAIKRTTMETDELFNDDTYDKSKEEEDESSGGSAVVIGVIVGIMMAVTLGGILFFVL